MKNFDFIDTSNVLRADMSKMIDNKISQQQTIDGIKETTVGGFRGLHLSQIRGFRNSFSFNLVGQNTTSKIVGP